MLTGLVPDQSVFSIGQFASNLHAQTGDAVVGYSFSIEKVDLENPLAPGTTIGVTGSGGHARMSWDAPERAASSIRPQEIASLSKTITGAAFLRLLQEETNSAMSEMIDILEGPASDLLPQSWNTTVGFNSITVEELLTHTSGLRGASSNEGDAYSYGSLQDIAENVASVFAPTPPDFPLFVKEPDYYTGNFSFFRIIIPYLWSAVPNGDLEDNIVTGEFPLAVVPSGLAQSIIDDWTPDYVSGEGVEGTIEITPGELTASIYKYYVSSQILEPAGISSPQTKPIGNDPTLFYPIPAITNLFTIPGELTDDQITKLGPRGWNLSAFDYGKFLTAISFDDSILEPATRELMEERNLGWQNATSPNFGGLFGRYNFHSGLNVNPAAGSQATVDPAAKNNTIGMTFPNGVQAAMLFNSQIRAEEDSPYLIGKHLTSDGSGTNVIGTMRNAYDNAWTELVYDGVSTLDVVTNPTIFSADDTFTIRQNTNPLFIDIVHSATGAVGATITRRLDTLHKLTLNSYEGVDTFNIEWLPEGLEIVINGGNDADTVILGGQTGSFNLADNSPGTLTFHGGAGLNELTIDDTDDNDLNQTYTITSDRVTRTGAGTYWYYDVSELTLNANGQANVIDVQSTTNSTVTTINGQGGNDTITLGGAEIDDIHGLIDVVGGDDDDIVRFWDVFSFTANDFEFRSNALLLGTSAVIGYGEDDDIELWAGNADDTVTVESLAVGQTLDLTLGHGDDDVNVNLLSNPLTTSVLGKVTVHGGSGNSDTVTVNDATSFNGTDYSITGSTVHRPGIEPIEYDGIETLNVDGAIPASTYDIHSTTAVTNVTGGPLGDTFDVGQFRLDFIDGMLTINGGGNSVGEDTVTLHDLAGGNNLYILANNALAGATFATIQLNEVEQATLDANPFDNDFVIENAPGPTRYTINGGSGNNAYALASNTGNLSTFNTPLIINGGAIDQDTLILHDESAPGSISFTVTNNSIDRLLFGEHSLLNTNIGVTFNAIDEVELHMNEHSSNVNVDSTNSNTKYIFHGNEGNDTLNLNRHLDEDDDPFVDIDGIAVMSATMDVEHDDFEQLNLNLGEELNTVRVHNLDSPTSINLGLGDDWVFVTPDSQNLNAIHFPMVVDGQSGTDRLHLLDGNYGADAQYTVTKNAVDRFLFGPLIAPGVTYFDLDIVRLFMGPGDNVVDIDTTAPGTEYFLDGGFGDDTFNVNHLPTSPLTLFGSMGEDHAAITGTEADDEVSISAGVGTADINMSNTETATFDGLGGTDVLVGSGVAGSDEQMEVEASTTADAGNLRIITTTPRGSSLLNIAFERTELLDLLANPADMDTAAFIGTNQDDQFAINLGAAGTNAESVLQVFQPDGISPLLALRDYRNFGSLAIEGRDGADVFSVYVAPTGPGTGHRDLLIDGGLPSGPGNNDDRLTVYWQGLTPPPPPPGPPPSTGSPVGHDEALDQFFVDYDPLHQFWIDYLDVEQAMSANANAA